MHTFTHVFKKKYVQNLHLSCYSNQALFKIYVCVHLLLIVTAVIDQIIETSVKWAYIQCVCLCSVFEYITIILKS